MTLIILFPPHQNTSQSYPLTAKEMLQIRTLELHISKELQMSIDELYTSEGRKASFQSFIRRMTLETLEPQLQAFSSWEKRGRTWTLPNGESIEISQGTFPSSFESFDDSNYTRSETETIRTDYPAFAYEGAKRCAALQNSIVIFSMKKLPELAGTWKIYRTTGDWFKDVVFVPSFLIKSNEVEKSERTKLLEKFDREVKQEDASSTEIRVTA